MSIIKYTPSRIRMADRITQAYRVRLKKFETKNLGIDDLLEREMSIEQLEGLGFYKKGNMYVKNTPVGKRIYRINGNTSKATRVI